MLTVEGKKSYQLDNSSGQWLVDGHPFEGSIYSEGNGKYVIIHNNKSYSALVSPSSKHKALLIKVNGRSYPIQIKDRLDLLVEKMGMTTNADISNNSIKAPMPGKILSVHVKAGDLVERGQKLCVLEAMKMENSIKADMDGEVTEVLIEKDQTVEKNQLLIKF